MKFIICLTMLISSYAAFSQESLSNDPNHSGNCKIAQPYETDVNGRHCSKGNFGILFGNKVFSCHATEIEAIKEMRQMKSCNSEVTVGHCSILTSYETDKNGAGCMPSGYIPVVYKGYTINKTACYKNLDNAVKAMERSSICMKNDSIADFAIIYPNDTDLGSKFCRNSYGVTYKGRFAVKDCFSTIEKAMKKMEELKNEI